jgi:hypothetical protein
MNQPKVDQGMTVVDSLSGQTVRGRSATGELAQAASIALAEANVKTRIMMARQFPRVWQQVEQRLMADCERPSFAEVARYRKPVGDGIEGPSIRFAEAAMRTAGNMEQASSPQYEDDEKRVLLVTVTDYEHNNTFGATVTVPKLVERSQLNGRTPLGSRTNSRGKIVFLVAATGDEMLNTENAMVSKAVRTLILRHIPSDIVENCMERCREVKLDKKAKDPRADMNAILANFAGMGVNAGQVAEYLDHGFDHGLTDKESLDLWGLASAIRDGEATWAEALGEQLRMRQTTVSGDGTKPAAPVETPAEMEARFMRRIEGAKSAASFKRVLAGIAIAQGLSTDAMGRLRERSKAKKAELSEKRPAEPKPVPAGTETPPATETPQASPEPSQPAGVTPAGVISDTIDDAEREGREYDAYVAANGKEPAIDDDEK